MWICNYLSEENEAAQAEVCSVEQVNSDGVMADGKKRISNALSLSPFGIKTSPSKGDEAVLIPLADGRYVLLGALRKTQNEGEVEISSPSGGYIKLKANGEIELNGATITTDGKFVEKQ